MLLPKNEKDQKERKKTALIIVLQFLLENGYTESLTKLEQETSLDLNEHELADNIDLLSIIKDFEDYYQYKYDKKPQLIKKRVQVLPKKNLIRKNGTQNLPSISKNIQNVESKENCCKNNNMQTDKKVVENDSKGILGLQIHGKSTTVPSQVNSKDIEDWEPKMIQGLPDSIKGNEELCILAKSLQRDIVTKNPNVKFDQIVGLENCKRILKEAILLPLKLSELFQKNLIDPWSGVLLFGPSGTGKTQIAKAVATECGTTFFNISASSIISKYHGKLKRRVGENGAHLI